MAAIVDASFEGLARAGAAPPAYVADAYRYRRRPTRVVAVGRVGVGGTNPIRVQSMTTTDTMDTEATVAQTLRLVQAGCEIVRITAPTVEDARNIGNIRRVLRSRGVRVPLVADIHFSPAAALEAADHVEKVRINPGNFADSKRFAVREYSDAEYLAELARIEERFAPLVEKCKARGVAMRIGTNHGSLSDRIMNRFGDTPLGMVESALEFARICGKYGYHDLIFSMKASNPKVMIQAYRLLAARLDGLGLRYPFHLGVTEAGNGEDGRIKSAIGIGSLLEDGIGDTIRVSLTEEPECEIPVAVALSRPYQGAEGPTGEAGGYRRTARQGAVAELQVAAQSPDSFPAGHDEAGLRPAARSPLRGRAGDQRVGPASASHCRAGDGASGLPDLRNPYTYARRAARTVAVGGVAIGGGQPVRVVHPFLGELARVERAAERAVALAAAAGRLHPRPDALSVFARTEADADMLGRLQGALRDAGGGLPLLVRVPLDWAVAARAARAADMVAISVAGGAVDAGPQGTGVRRALEAIAAAGRPVLLEAVPDEAEADTAAAAAGAADRVFQAARIAAAAGCANVVLSVGTRRADLAVRTYRLLASRLVEIGGDYPLHLLAWPGGDQTEVLLRASVVLGSLLCDGIGDSIQIMGAAGGLDDRGRVRLAFDILQGAGVRLSKTEFVACPSCGRTLFNLQETTARIQRKTGHLRGVKIAIMGCIVNGPGEMADADFGYVGGAPGRVNLYVGKACVEKGVPAAVADERLIELIRAHGKWADPPERPG